MLAGRAHERQKTDCYGAPRRAPFIRGGAARARSAGGQNYQSFSFFFFLALFSFFSFFSFFSDLSFFFFFFSGLSPVGLSPSADRF